MPTRLPLALLLVAAGAIAGLAAAPAQPGAAAQNLVGNPSFDGPAQDGLAAGWRNNTWGDTKATFALETTRPHSGPTCQKIEAVRGANGAAQFLFPLKVEARKRYQMRVWVRAEGKVPFVGLSLRQSPEPYRAYLRGQLRPTGQWQLLEAAGFVPDSDDNAGLYIWFEPQGAGTVWVDDAGVQIVEPSAALGPPPTGNVIPNGGFELDTARTWEPSGAGEAVPAPWPPALAAAPAAEGKRAMHARLQAGASFRLTTPCFPFYGNNLPLTLACSARATGGPVRLQVVLRSADTIGQPDPMLQLAAQPDSALKRYATTGKVLCSYVGAYWLEVTGRAEQEAELWFDALSLSPQGEAYRASAPLEAALSTKLLANVFATGETVRLKVEVQAAAAPRAALRLQVRDYRERLVCEVPVRVARAGLTVSEVAVPVKQVGAFRADLVEGGSLTPRPPLRGGEGESERGGKAQGGCLASLVFACLPPPRNVAAAQSNIGGHFSTASDWQLQVARRLGYHWTRIHDCSSLTHWRTAEPKQGEWHFFDEDVARVKRAGLEILGEFLRVPDWATTAAPDTEDYRVGVGPYRNVADFETYVRTVVGHYKGNIHYWEIWNEPYGRGFYGGSAEEYAVLAQAAARAAKSADPNCRLLAPCTFPMSVDWTERVLAAGGLAGADLFSYHGYGCLTKTPYDNVNRWAVRDGKPLGRWNSETGVTADTFYRHICNKLDSTYARWAGRTPVEEAVIQSLKLFVLAIASGAERYFYYWTNVEAGMAPRMNSMSIYEYDRSIRPHGVVYAAAAAVLDPSVGAGVESYPCGLTACYLQHGSAAIAVLWAEDAEQAVRLSLDGLRDCRVLDTMGNPLAPDVKGLEVDRHPVYLVAPGMRGEELRARVGRLVRAAR